MPVVRPNHLPAVLLGFCAALAFLAVAAAAACHIDSAALCEELGVRLRAHGESRLAADSPRQPSYARLLSTSTAAPIRILPVYQLSASLPSELQTAVVQAVNAAVKTLQNYISVNVPVSSSGLLAVPQSISAQTCAAASSCTGPGLFPSFNPSIPSTDIKAPYCGPAKIDAAYVLGTECNSGTSTNFVPIPGCSISVDGNASGAQTDMYLYVTTDELTCAAGVAAYGLPCMFDYTTNRPVLSAVNLCNITLQTFTPDKLLATITHEITHTLGFISGLFEFFIDSSGALLEPSTVTKYIPLASSPTVYRSNYTLITTPNVVAQALADTGTTSTLLPLQTKEEMAVKAVTGSTSCFRYTVNWTASSHLDWGRNAGCNLATYTSQAYMAATASQPYFCSTSSSTAICTFNGLSRGYCTVSKFAESGVVGGGQWVGAAAGARHRIGETERDTRTVLVSCPSPYLSCLSQSTAPIASIVNGPLQISETTCTSSYYTNSGSASVDASGDIAFGWAIGSAARCSVVSLPMSASTPLPYGLILSLPGQSSSAVCWNATCSPNNVLYFTIKGTAVACPSGSTIPLSSISSTMEAGTITCPLNTGYCRTLRCSTSCNALGADCFEGSCVCRLGYLGADCSVALLQQEVVVIASLPPPSPPPPGSPSSSSSGGAGGGDGALSGAMLYIVIGVAAGGGAIILLLVALIVYCSCNKRGKAAVSASGVPAAMLDGQAGPGLQAVPAVAGYADMGYSYVGTTPQYDHYGEPYVFGPQYAYGDGQLYGGYGPAMQYNPMALQPYADYGGQQEAQYGWVPVPLEGPFAGGPVTPSGAPVDYRGSQQPLPQLPAGATRPEKQHKAKGGKKK